MTYIALTLFALCVLLPIFHMINCLPCFSKKTRQYLLNEVKVQKGMSIIIPCYNEEPILEAAVTGMQRMDYQNKEVIYVNDGSTDGTLKMLDQLLELKLCHASPVGKLDYEKVECFYISTKYENVYVIDKKNGGKADALNAGIDHSNKELIITLDADSILDMKALNIINQSFQDEDVIAAGGMVHVLQGKKFETGSLVTQTMKLKPIVTFQILEYLKGFYIYKFSLAKVKALAIISGAFGVFNKDVMFEVGGYRNTVGEDIDITLRFQEYILSRKEKKIMFVPEAICYTECPENWMDLFKQRVRWQKAFMDCIVEYRKMLFKTFLYRPVSFFFLVDALLTGTFATFLTVFWAVHIVVSLAVHSDQTFNYIFLVGSLIINPLYNVIAVIVSKQHGTTFKGWDKLRLFNVMVLDLCVFRLITMFYIVYGSLAYFVNKEGWNKVERTGRKYKFEKAS